MKWKKEWKEGVWKTIVHMERKKMYKIANFRNEIVNNKFITKMNYLEGALHLLFCKQWNRHLLVSFNLQSAKKKTSSVELGWAIKKKHYTW